jgi:hypothetical protein
MFDRVAVYLILPGREDLHRQGGPTVEDLPTDCSSPAGRTYCSLIQGHWHDYVGVAIVGR